MIKSTLIQKITAVLLAAFFVGCQSEVAHEHDDHHDDHHDDIHLTTRQVRALGLKWGVAEKVNISGMVEASGMLEVPPQNQASVTAIMGANIREILVIQGHRVRKGQPLLYLEHPEIVKLQADYQTQTGNLEFLEQEVNRQQKLYQENVGSGRELQRAKSELKSAEARIAGLRAQLQMLGLSPEKIREGEIAPFIAVRAPIAGYITNVMVKTGQFVQPQDIMLEIINKDHIHADLLIYEKDIAKVAIGQKVEFTTESDDTTTYVATIFAVGKSLEPGLRAIHVHADIDDEVKADYLLPGMYVRGRILGAEKPVFALPRDAVVREGDRHYIFVLSRKPKNEEDENAEWEFEPVEVAIGMGSDRYVAFKPMEPLDSNAQIVKNKAYFLLSEWKKHEAGHDHDH